MFTRQVMNQLLFTSESASEGHPHKVSDQISDAVLDAYLEQDPYLHIACEVFCTTEHVTVGGEFRSKGKVDIEKMVRETLRNIGYTHKNLGIGADNCEVNVLNHPSFAAS